TGGYRGEFRNEPTPNAGFRNNPAPNAGFRNEQPPNTGFRGNNPTPNAGFRNEQPPNTGFRGNNPTPNTGFRNEPAPNTGFRNNTPAPQASAPNSERFGSRQIPQNQPNRGAFGGIENGAAARVHSDHGYSSLGPSRSAGAAPPPREAPHEGG